MIWRGSAGVRDASNERSATTNNNRTAIFMDSSCPLPRTSSVTWRGTEAKPLGAALARGPGESCGNRQEDGEELHPRVAYLNFGRDSRDIAVVSCVAPRRRHLNAAYNCLLNRTRRSMFNLNSGPSFHYGGFAK